MVPDQCRLIGNEGYGEVVCDCSGSGYTGDLCTEGKLDLGRDVQMVWWIRLYRGPICIE